MIYATISGSLRKCLKEIKEVITIFENNKVIILSPKISKIQDPEEDFIYFEKDFNKPIRIIEQTHLHNITQSDLLYIVNPNGYIGNSTLLEIGYALANKIKVFSSCEPTDTLLKNFLIYNMAIPDIIKLTSVNKIELNNNQRLSELQLYVRRKVIERGFEDENEKDILILLLEEMGEIARIIRKYTGLKVKNDSLNNEDHKIEEELADIFIYVLILANKFGIDLYESFKSKELKNDTRIWTTFNSLLK